MYTVGQIFYVRTSFWSYLWQSFCGNKYFLFILTPLNQNYRILKDLISSNERIDILLIKIEGMKKQFFDCPPFPQHTVTHNNNCQ